MGRRPLAVGRRAGPWVDGYWEQPRPGYVFVQPLDRPRSPRVRAQRPMTTMVASSATRSPRPGIVVQPSRPAVVAAAGRAADAAGGRAAGASVQVVQPARRRVRAAGAVGGRAAGASRRVRAAARRPSVVVQPARPSVVQRPCVRRWSCSAASGGGRAAAASAVVVRPQRRVAVQPRAVAWSFGLPAAVASSSGRDPLS
jgi:hypothetical protein